VRGNRGGRLLVAGHQGGVPAPVRLAVGGAVYRTAAAARLGGKPGRMFAVLVIDGRAIGHLDIF